MTKFNIKWLRALLFFTIWLIFLLPITTFSAPNNSPSLDDKIAALEARLQVSIESGINSQYAELSKQYLLELREHRAYLADLDDKFYEHITFWIPAVSIFVTLLFTIIMFWTGHSKNEAVKASILEVQNRITLDIKTKVNDRAIAAGIDSTLSDKLAEMQEMTEGLVNNYKTQLEEIKTDLVSHNSDIIRNSVEENIKTKFSKEFDQMKRVDELEKRVSNIGNIVKQHLANHSVPFKNALLDLELAYKPGSDESVNALNRAAHITDPSGGTNVDFKK